MRLTLHSVPASHGKRWLIQGWQLFRKAPLPLSALLASYLVMWLLASLLGIVGATLMLACLPLLSLVYMVAAHQLLQQKPVGFAVWAQPFKLGSTRLQAQLQLGFLYVILTVGLMLLAHAVDGGALEQVQEAMARSGGSPEEARAAEAALIKALESEGFLSGMLIRLGGSLLISIPFWHAPALVHWGGHGALKALFSSCVGVWNNRAAFFVNGLLWAGLLLLASLALALLVTLLQAPTLLSLFVMPLLLLLSTVFYCGLYFIFVDCFRFSAEPTP